MRSITSSLSRTDIQGKIPNHKQFEQKIYRIVQSGLTRYDAVLSDLIKLLVRQPGINGSNPRLYQLQIYNKLQPSGDDAKPVSRLRCNFANSCTNVNDTSKAKVDKSFP